MPSLRHVSLNLPAKISLILHFFRGKMQQRSREFSETVSGLRSYKIILLGMKL